MTKIKAIDKTFKIIIVLKGIHATLEIILGMALFLLSKEFISNGIIFAVERNLAGNPSGFIAQYLSDFGIELSLAIKLFFAIYFISHGAVNLSLVYGIIKKPSFAYPVSLFAFFGFLIYETYSYFVAASTWLLLLIIFDVLFIILLFYEYNHHLKKYSFLGKLRLIAVAKVPRIIRIRLPKIIIPAVNQTPIKESLDDKLS